MYIKVETQWNRFSYEKGVFCKGCIKNVLNGIIILIQNYIMISRRKRSICLNQMFLICSEQYLLSYEGTLTVAESRKRAAIHFKKRLCALCIPLEYSTYSSNDDNFCDTGLQVSWSKAQKVENLTLFSPFKAKEKLLAPNESAICWPRIITMTTIGLIRSSCVHKNKLC